MFIAVQSSGTRSWIQRLVIRGRRRKFGLSSLAFVPLAEAREMPLANRKLASATVPLIAPTVLNRIIDGPFEAGTW
jgi:hypothetical protein